MNGWVVIANSSYAEIFELNGKQLTSIELISYPDGRLRGREIVSDRPGRGFESSGGGLRHAYTSSTSPHTHEQDIFAHRIAEKLQKAKATNQFEHLVLIAPPVFLGILRPLLSETIKKCIHREISKDIPEALSENERKEAVCKYLEIEKVRA